MLGTTRQNLLKIGAYLHLLRLFNIRKYLQLSENALNILERLPSVLFEDDTDAHVRISSKEDFCLSRGSAHLINNDFFLKVNNLMFVDLQSHCVESD